MADLAVTVKYEDDRARNSWTGFAIFCMWWYGLGIAAVSLGWSWLIAPHATVVIVFISLLAGGYAYLPFVVAANRLREANIFINGAGMLLPQRFGIGNQRQINWNELRLIDIDEQRRILLTMTSGSKIKLDGKKLDNAQIEKVLLAMEVFSPSTNWTDRSVRFKDSLQSGAINQKALTFTQMWEDELRQHFTATNFVPHEPGAKLRSGRLTIIRQMAFGGFSAVYLAEDRERRETIILKENVIRSGDPQAQEKAKQMFRREAAILASLDHDKIAHVYDHFSEQDRSYLMIEHISGDNLRALIVKGGPMAEARVVDLALSMLGILKYLHHREPPVIHRDFTPDNLILSPSGKVTLVDFGTANEFVAQATGTLVGKQSYMPIEQVRGKAEPRSDLYALGCTLYFLLTGKDPEPLSVCIPRSQKPDVCEAFNQLVMNLTQIEPVDRYADTAAVEAALQALHVSQPAPSKT